MASEIAGNSFVVRKKIMTVGGAKFEIFDAQEKMILFSGEKVFTVKEDIRVYTDASMTEERFNIKARTLIGVNIIYDVISSATTQKIGALRHKGIAMRDSWEVLDGADKPVGTIEDPSLLMSILRTFLGNLIPRNWAATLDGKAAGTFKRSFNPMFSKLNVELVAGAGFDPTLAIAAGILLEALAEKKK